MLPRHRGANRPAAGAGPKAAGLQQGANGGVQPRRRRDGRAAVHSVHVVGTNTANTTTGTTRKAGLSLRDRVQSSGWGGVLGMSHQEEAPGQTQDSLEGLCSSASLGTSWCPPGEASGGCRGEGGLGLVAAPALWIRGR